ncbi:MAG: hypothetical protein CM15mP32_1500 [Flavobacteriaceae bacterium]|nr:MAG: hypothetical protein CM15mP32_1500 [Flavobacteriaceae bacterium]
MSSEVRLVGDNVEMGVYPIAKAMSAANELELDLVEISPNATPLFVKSSTIRSSYTSRKSVKKFKSQS